jgi:hypothetical protein
MIHIPYVLELIVSTHDCQPFLPSATNEDDSYSLINSFLLHDPHIRSCKSVQATPSTCPSRGYTKPSDLYYISELPTELMLCIFDYLQPGAYTGAKSSRRSRHQISHPRNPSQIQPHQDLLVLWVRWPYLLKITRISYRRPDRCGCVDVPLRYPTISPI